MYFLENSFVSKFNSFNIIVCIWCVQLFPNPVGMTNFCNYIYEYVNFRPL